MILPSISVIVLLICTLFPLTTHAVSFVGKSNSATAKIVTLRLSNKSNQPMDLTTEDKVVTLSASGREYKLRVPEGTKIYGADKTVKETVTRDLEEVICIFR